MKLFRYERPVASLFDALGTSENNMTESLGLVLSRSRLLLERFVCHHGCPTGARFEDAVLRLQTSRTRSGHGITDLEILLEPDFMAILEAKRGQELPGSGQLAKYAPLIANSGVRHGCLIAVTNKAADIADMELRGVQFDGVPVSHYSWKQILADVQAIRSQESHSNKRIIDEFSTYLTEILGMQVKYSNLVWVVALGAGNPDNWNISWIDIVRKRRRYFHPIGGGYPADPMNYLGFRYHGKLQSIHHVDEYKVISNPHDVFPEAPDERWGPTYCYKLGAPIVPPHEVRTGKRIQQANRVWCMIDTLLTCATISDAKTETDRRGC